MNSKTQHSVLMMALVLAVMIFFTACKSKAERVQEQLDLGQKYLTESNYTEAILAFTKAIEIDPESIPAYMGRAQAYRGTEQYEEAKTDYTTVIDKTEEQPYTQAEAYVGRAEVDELTEENTRLRSEEQELSRLRELYQLDQDYMEYNKVGARIIAKDSSSWFSVFRIDKGSEDGIRENMNVIAGGGLVGIVTDVGTNYATVRSIIDDSSQVSAMAQQSGDTCIVSGDLRLFKEGRLRLSYMEKDDDVKDGDMIVTSNISGKFLPGILIGYATDITVDYHDNLTKSGYLIPAARFDRLQEVLVITDLKDAGPELDE